MRDSAASPFAVALTWLAVVLSTALLIAGTLQHGFSMDVHHRFWSDIQDRIHGPMTFRFYLQPAMALIAAIPDGIHDARSGDPSQHDRLRQGLLATARIILLGLSMDVIYQYRVLDQFYPAEAVMMAILLAILPYFLFRWIIGRIARRFGQHRPRSTT